MGGPYISVSGTGVPKHNDNDNNFHTNSLRRTTALAESIPRHLCDFTNLTAATSGVLNLTAIDLPLGISISSITFCSGATNLAGGTAQWFCLYSSALAKLAVTGDDVATAWGTNAVKALPISRIVTDGVTNGTTTLTSATAAFTQADVGKQIMVPGSGAAGACLGNSGSTVTISTVSNATTVIMSAAAADTASGKTVYIQTPYTTTTSGLHYVGIMIGAGTVPTTRGRLFANGTVSVLTPNLTGSSTGTLTTPSSAPDPAAAITGTLTFPYFYLL